MYRHRPQRFTTSQQPIFKLSAFQEDEKLRFVDSVCATLMTSRFGDGAMYTLNRRFRGTADEPFDFLDLLKDAEIGWHEAATFLGRTLLGRAFSGGSLQKPARSKGIGLTDTTLGRNPTPCETPANLGRGSPTFLGRSCSRLPCVLSELCVRFRRFSRKAAEEPQKILGRANDTFVGTDLDL